MKQQHPFKWRHFQAESILLCGRWYVRYALRYRDLEEMMAERGLGVDHSTILRWVQWYAPQLDKRSRPHEKATNDSWRVEETDINVKKEWVSLYRAIASQGQTLEFFFRPIRDAQAAKHFLLKTLAASPSSQSRVITVDKNAASPKAFAELKGEGHLCESCELRHVNSLNTLVEQDHRAHQTVDETWHGLFLV